MQNKIEVHDFSFFYGAFQALKNLNLGIREKHITALIGPSGCGKSTFLRCLNRMNDTIRGTHAEGTVLLDGNDIYAPEVDVAELRQHVGMVFQRPNPFPQSIYDNVAFGPRVLSMTKSTRRSGPDRPRELGRCGAVERGQASPAGSGVGTESRPAAAALHRPHDRGQAQRHFDG